MHDIAKETSQLEPKLHYVHIPAGQTELIQVTFTYPADTADAFLVEGQGIAVAFPTEFIAVTFLKEFIVVTFLTSGHRLLPYV
ncbi:hypothetical protein BaRGS_00020900 [Batillaria attramentaria]|uniref:Uncharacterized protein n=1 Tax=Batillaria attramentaria TaxID=370345 RepID=A0ABD0KKU9_9CAEN